jgi:hypothetical protein
MPSEIGAPELKIPIQECRQLCGVARTQPQNSTRVYSAWIELRAMLVFFDFRQCFDLRANSASFGASAVF